MVSRQETARPLLTPGEVMQLPATDELVFVSGVQPFRAKNARYYEDRRLQQRILPAPSSAELMQTSAKARQDGWSILPSIRVDPQSTTIGASDEDPDNSGIRREPALPEYEAIAPETPTPSDPFAMLVHEADDEPVQASMLQQRMCTVARQAALDPGDGLDL